MSQPSGQWAIVDVEFGLVVSKGEMKELEFAAQGFGVFGLNLVLILLLAEAVRGRMRLSAHAHSSLAQRNLDCFQALRGLDCFRSVSGLDCSCLLSRFHSLDFQLSILHRWRELFNDRLKPF